MLIFIVLKLVCVRNIFLRNYFLRNITLFRWTLALMGALLNYLNKRNRLFHTITEIGIWERQYLQFVDNVMLLTFSKKCTSRRRAGNNTFNDHEWTHEKTLKIYILHEYCWCKNMWQEFAADINCFDDIHLFQWLPV